MNIGQETLNYLTSNVQGLFAKYERLERELKEVISKEDMNTFWLYSRHEDFIEEMKSINELVAVLKQSL
ncbi:hypothetical protein [Bacillus cereus]|uniref:hypothetical protein n=1 Tax=Bacillus cereus TaxID=1396 RepID=UPI002366A005|nr:hypothetical protein [Bacillus cereus]MDD8003264.1 hypothetical protein [Bacillus cereus]